MDNVELIKTEDNNNQNNNDNNKSCNIFRRFIKFLGRLIKRGNSNYFEIKKENEKPVKISLTISAILLLFAFKFVLILLVIGLFLGYKYSVNSNDENSIKVNDIFDKASESVKDIKNDFNEGYHNS